MFIVQHYALAVFFCFITMLCWGSWANTQKLAAKKWRFELFYWDYVWGLVILSLLAAFTLGSSGSEGRPFMADLVQASPQSLGSAFAGGVVFNLANILLTAAIAGAGMAVAFPIGIGLALVIGVVLNYVLLSKGNPTLLFAGVTLVTVAILLNAQAYRQKAQVQQRMGIAKWIVIAVIAGILMSCFYPFVAAGMDLENFVHPADGKMTPYTAFVLFAAGVLTSNILFNSILMKRPLDGPALSYKTYFGGKLRWHAVGVLGGAIWAVGNLLNLLAAGKAGPAISYGLGQGATLVAALWGVWVWKEFKDANRQTNYLLTGMFVCFILGIFLIIKAGT
ncbi:GRP family sugar transporter [Olivibacter ginsenosidimutans]|uniref:GRP family sugar transporter n=1 Tax=Olivibacter ginsenosidimutans TaxID=1176537 RepID=A0ABP9ADW9_9SPHI